MIITVLSLLVAKIGFRWNKFELVQCVQVRSSSPRWRGIDLCPCLLAWWSRTPSRRRSRAFARVCFRIWCVSFSLKSFRTCEMVLSAMLAINLFVWVKKTKRINKTIREVTGLGTLTTAVAHALGPLLLGSNTAAHILWVINHCRHFRENFCPVYAMSETSGSECGLRQSPVQFSRAHLLLVNRSIRL